MLDEAVRSWNVRTFTKFVDITQCNGHYAVVKVTVDSRGGPKFKNTTLQKWIKHMHHESVIK